MEKIQFRSILETDFQRIKDLHEEFFPVRYSDQFYHDSCREIGVNGAPLYTSLAVEINAESTSEGHVNGEKVVGFIFAQYVPHASSEDKYIISDGKREDLDMFYILTLGVCKEYRKHGLGSKLLSQSTNYAKRNPRCGCIYLHVIHSNANAIMFYEKAKFLKFNSIHGLLTDFE